MFRIHDDLNVNDLFLMSLQTKEKDYFILRFSWPCPLDVLWPLSIWSVCGNRFNFTFSLDAFKTPSKYDRIDFDFGMYSSIFPLCSINAHTCFVIQYATIWNFNVKWINLINNIADKREKNKNRRNLYGILPMEMRRNTQETNERNPNAGSVDTCLKKILTISIDNLMSSGFQQSWYIFISNG